MDLNYKLVVLLIVVILISLSVISGNNTKYQCSYSEEPSKCNVLNVNLDTKIDFFERFSIHSETSNDYLYDDYGRRRIRLTELNFINSSVVYIPRSIFTELPYVTTLNMIGCNLVAISPYDFANAENLVILNLSRNVLTELKYWTFKGARNLKEINLAYNQIGRIEANTFQHLDSLRILDLSSNQIAAINTDTFGSLNLLELNLNSNRITTIDEETFRIVPVERLRIDFNDITNIMINFQNIGSVSLNNNAIVELTIAPDANVNLLYANNNRIQLFIILSDSETKLQKLSLANNSLSDLDFMGFMVALRYVDLSFNPLSADHIGGGTFLRSTNLQSLYLADLNLNHLDFQQFSTLQSLEILDVSDNNLRTINFNGFKSLHNLKQLYISGNSLNQVNTVDLEDLFSKVYLIDITDHDLQCQNVFEIFEKLRQINRKLGLDGKINNLVIHGVTCQNHELLGDGIQNNSNYYYLELKQMQFELNGMKKENENLKFQLADKMASHKASINGINEYLKQLTEQISVLNATKPNINDNTKTNFNLVDLFDGSTGHYNGTSIRKDDGKIVNILIV